MMHGNHLANIREGKTFGSLFPTYLREYCTLNPSTNLHKLIAPLELHAGSTLTLFEVMFFLI